MMSATLCAFLAGIFLEPGGLCLPFLVDPFVPQQRAQTPFPQASPSTATIPVIYSNSQRNFVFYK